MPGLTYKRDVLLRIYIVMFREYSATQVNISTLLDIFTI